MMRRLYACAVLAALVLVSPAAADMYPDAANAKHPAARRNLAIPDADRTLWSSYGIVADGTTDNTAALNALPQNIPLLADCKGSGDIRYNGVWLLKSNLNIKWQDGCRLMSYIRGAVDGSIPGGYAGTFAISQADLTVPLDNVRLEGMRIAKDAMIPNQRILQAWINNFRLLTWTFQSHGGAMFLRGSCQEVAFGRSIDASTIVGSPGVRHIGNMPKAAAGCRHQPADVWIHNNNIVSGDAVYQACQPTTGAPWNNVSTDDILYENNDGLSGASAYALIGAQWTGVPEDRNYTCKNITYTNNTGRGTSNGILISASGTGSLGSPITISNVRYYNQMLSAEDDSNNTGTVHMRAKDGGIIDGVTFRALQLIETHSAAFVANAACTPVPVGEPPVPSCTSDGAIKNVLFQGGLLDSPQATSSGGVWSPNINVYSAENITFQSNTIRGAHAGGLFTVLVGQDNNAGNPRTVSKLRMLGNFFENLPATSTAIELRNVAGADIAGNVFRPSSGATAVEGIKMTVTGVNGPGTTDTTITSNTLNGLATPLLFQCNGGTTSIAAYNVGDAGHTCP